MNRPVKGSGCLLRVGDDRYEQMRNAVVDFELDDLRVDHQHFDFIWCGLIKDAHDQRINTDGFSGSCSPCDQQVRHFGYIRDDSFA